MNNPDNLNNGSPPSASSNANRALFGIRGLLRWVGQLVLGLLAVSVLAVLLLRWIAPPTTSFMLQRQYDAWVAGNEHFELKYQWTDWQQISSSIKMAAITSEDQAFANHWGIDLQSIQQAVEEYEKGQDLRGASTITQQVAKNLFLWPAPSFFRKGIEAYFALLIELMWSKQRILEMYLNIAEFGDGIYGVQSAAQHYFHTTAAKLSKFQSALMVTALPAPRRYNLANPSNYMLERRSWVLRYMDLLGNGAYLKKLE
ncbi:MAG: monofunctional biosynthetic peptidoglycan transglycosylase [Fodinibius sp.]|nr:monofunctional biosynthetic peptidoglycan transglycosylase [Fodinibius sp.]